MTGTIRLDLESTGGLRTGYAYGVDGLVRIVGIPKDRVSEVERAFTEEFHDQRGPFTVERVGESLVKMGFTEVGVEGQLRVFTASDPERKDVVVKAKPVEVALTAPTPGSEPEPVPAAEPVVTVEASGTLQVEELPAEDKQVLEELAKPEEVKPEAPAKKKKE